MLYGTKGMMGLDIGSSSVKCVLLEAGENGYSLVSASIADIDRSDPHSSDQTSNVIEAIDRCVKDTHMRIKLVACGVCGPEVAVRRFYFPKLDEKDLAIEIIYEAEQVCPFEDGQFLVAATRNLVLERNQLVQKASLNCVLLDVNSLALLNCFVECEKPESGVTFGVLDIGSKFMNLVISNDKALPYVRDIPNASNGVIEHIAKQTDLTLMEVTAILRDRNTLSDDMMEALKNASSVLAADVQDSLRYYTSQDGNAVDRLYVCGGFAQTRGFVELLGKELPCETVLWDPFEKMEIKGRQRNKSIETIAQYGPSLALATGLAMRKI